MNRRQKYIDQRCIPEPNTGCWLWLLSRSSNGYGNACDPHTGLICNAHRLSFMAHHHEDIAQKMVLHKCNERLCVNPDHIYLGTHEDNMNDLARGGYHPNRKLRDEHPEIIRRLLAEKVPQKKIATAFGVSQRVIQAIDRGDSYRFN